MRGNEITIAGQDAEQVGRLFEELVLLLQQGQPLDSANVARSIDMVRVGRAPERGADRTRSCAAPRAGTVRPKTAGQKRYVDAIRANVITFGLGPAGTGKSWLAVAMAVQALQAKEVQRIILTRPAVEAGERLGFLPGDLMAKVDPYLRPLYDALYDMVEPEGAQKLLERQTVEVAPLAFMRGRTLNDSFIILDEAQNTTPEQMKMFLTRIGFGSKVVVTGDMTQVDVPGGRSGLIGLERILTGIDGLAFVHLTRADVVRHRIVADIVAAYENGRVTTAWVIPSTTRTWAGGRGSAATATPRCSWPTSRPSVPVDTARWAALAEAVLLAEGVRGHAELSLLFVDEDDIAALNEQFLGKAGPTDVLAFPIDAATVEVDVGPGAAPPRPRPPAARPGRPPAAARRRRGLPGGGRAPGGRARRHASTTSWPCSSCTACSTSSGHDHAEPDETARMRAASGSCSRRSTGTARRRPASARSTPA